MSHIYDLSNIHLLQPSVITIGVFDGVHLGHQHLIRRLVQEAHESERLAVVLTFFPHPDVVIRNIQSPHYLMNAEQRADMLLSMGVDCVITHPFSDEIRQIRAADFVDQLIRHLKVSSLWVGDDFALGYKREGNVAFLTDQGQQKGFTVEVVDMVESNSRGRISSSLIREALREGKVGEVRQWLGRGYSLTGPVVHGQKRGHMIGFPTANIDYWKLQVIPANGVYAGWAYLGEERFMAMSNVGVSPTFAYKGVTVEAYLLDFDREIYGESLTISFEKYLRPEAKFDNLEDLIAQIQLDVQEGRTYLLQLEASR